MQTAEQIIEDVVQTIAHVYERPVMYAGGLGEPGSADRLEVTLWHLHIVWARAFGRDDELVRVRDDARRAVKCGNFGHLDGYRMRHPGSDPKEQSEFVLAQWRGISTRMGLLTDSH
jgi:hypothetical protein